MGKSDRGIKPVKHRHDRIVIIGGGESLRGVDLSSLIDFDGAIITVNNVIFHLPRADYWMTVDPMVDGLPQRAMREQRKDTYYYCAFPNLEKNIYDKPYYTKVEGIHYLERIIPSERRFPEKYKLQEDKSKITTGDSMYGALGLAYHMEAKEIIILGLDVYGYGHWYDLDAPYNNAWGDRFEKYISRIPPIYKSSLTQFRKRGTKVINGSLYSKVDCFERMSPEEAIKYINKK